MTSTGRMGTTMKRGLRTWLCTLAAVSVVAFAPPADARKRSTCADCGTVVTTNRKDEKGSGTAGTVVGGVGGAVAGNVLGGNTTSTVLGGVGGAIAGNVIGKKMSTRKIWSVQVRMDNGSVQDVDFGSDPGMKQGQRVRVVNGTLERI